MKGVAVDTVDMPDVYKIAFMTAAKTVGDKIIFVIRKFSVYGNFSVFGQREDDFPQVAFEALDI